ncbi:MAG: hypothetical protein LAO05_17720 [Acidobacteriia bacterium]|nr:hypothetical protein [Terriglobia bacterium]
MNAGGRAAALLFVPALALLAGCDQPRRETPRDRITRLRLLHRVSANWYEVKKERDGRPVLVLDLTITNDGSESLNEVTMRLHLSAEDGKDRLVVPVTLDVSRIKPGTLQIHPRESGKPPRSEAKPGPPGHLVVGVPGVEVKPGEEITLEMQGQPSKEEMAKYPEYRGVS